MSSGVCLKVLECLLLILLEPVTAVRIIQAVPFLKSVHQGSSSGDPPFLQLLNIQFFGLLRLNNCISIILTIQFPRRHGTDLKDGMQKVNLLLAGRDGK
mmetsp:Transcript_97318/g.270818  ORF Transcript_97318/g.270818 Transcript_97318/m.270818 type:complete len:99 (-) Transcript_97318:296-592(-)